MRPVAQQPNVLVSLNMCVTELGSNNLSWWTNQAYHGMEASEAERTGTFFWVTNTQQSVPLTPIEVKPPPGRTS